MSSVAPAHLFATVGDKDGPTIVTSVGYDPAVSTWTARVPPCSVVFTNTVHVAAPSRRGSTIIARIGYTASIATATCCPPPLVVILRPTLTLAQSSVCRYPSIVADIGYTEPAVEITSTCCLPPLGVPL